EYEYQRRQRESEWLRRSADELAAHRSRLLDAVTQAESAGDLARARQLQARAEAVQRDLLTLDEAADRVLVDGGTSGVVRVDDDGHRWLNRDLLPTATGAVTTDERSALTGTDHPPSVTSSRRYGQRGGLR